MGRRLHQSLRSALRRLRLAEENAKTERSVLSRGHLSERGSLSGTSVLGLRLRLSHEKAQKAQRRTSSKYIPCAFCAFSWLRPKTKDQRPKTKDLRPNTQTPLAPGEECLQQQHYT